MTSANGIVQLNWIREPLGELLKAVNERMRRLEQWSDSKLDTDAEAALATWQECQSLLRQIQATLRMARVNGAAILATEILTLGDHLYGGDQPQVTAQHLQLLQEAQLTLQDYLDYVSINRLDQTLVLTRHVNRLREARHAELMHEGQLFFPLLDRPGLPIASASKLPAGKPDKLHGKWQRALRDWLQHYQTKSGKSQQPAADKLIGVALALANSELLPSDLALTCQLTAEVIRATQQDCRNNDIDIGRLLARLDVLLSLQGKTTDADETTAADDLSRAMLYFLASCEPADERVLDIREHYQLAPLIDQQSLDAARASLKGKNRALNEAVASAIHSELDELKNLVERLQLRFNAVPVDAAATATDNSGKDAQLAQSLHDSILRMAGSLQVIGFTEIAGRLRQHAPDLMQNQQQAQTALNQLASTLLDFESRLLANSGDLNSGHASDNIYGTGMTEVISQAIKLLDHAQQQMDALLRKASAGESGAAQTEQPQQQLQQVSGILHMINELPLALALRRGVLLLQQLDWESKSIQEQPQLQDFAAMLAALERYLISVADHARNQQMSDAVLAYAEQMPAAEPTTLAAVADQTTAAAPTADQDLLIDDQDSDVQASDDQDSNAGAGKTTAAETSVKLDSTPTSPTAAGATRSPLPALGEQRWESDPELQQIFLQELDELMDGLDQSVSEFISAPATDDTLVHIRRCFHTFKGSARMVGAMSTGDYAYAVETMLNAVRDHQLEPTAIVPVLPEVMQHIHAMHQALHGGHDICTDTTHALIRQCMALAGQPLIETQASSSEAEQATAAQQVDAEQVPADESLQHAEQPSQAEQMAAVAAAEEDEQEQFTSIINEELQAHVSTVDDFLLQCQQQHAAVPDGELIRSVHTISGTLALQPVADEHKVVHDIEGWLRGLRDQDNKVNRKGQAILAKLSALVRQYIDQTEAQADSSAAEWQSLSEQLQRRKPQQPAAKAPNADAGAGHPAQTVDIPQPAEELTEEPKELQPEEQADALPNALDTEPEDADTQAGKPLLPKSTFTIPDDPFATDSTDTDSWIDTGQEHTTHDQADDEEDDDVSAAAQATDDYAGLDESILEIFLDEAANGMDAMDNAVRRWLDEGELDAVADLRRSLHTMKGAANMAGLTAIGQLGHALESYLESQPLADMQPSELQSVESSIDQLHEMLGAVAVRAAMPTPDLSAFSALVMPPMDPELELEPADQPSTSSAAPTAKPAAAAAKSKQKPAPSPTDDTAKKAIITSRSSLRVDSGLIDQLSNIAGEVGIFRAHLEQETGKLRGGINEMGQTIERLRDQLRKLELETEAQILSRHQHEKTTATDFDPLELDRYSTIQQLSRALAESANDMMNLQETIDNTSQHSESLLAQQARANAELQDGLLQTRMVPFANIAPRLRQVVRRTTTELDKPAELSLDIQAGGELDRSALERITGPLEHLLRNALVHGIEDRPTRQKLDKPESGQITISVFREAAELIIRVRDDGRGLDMQSILERARDKGLIAADAEPDERETAQLIFMPGFSTAAELSELAGRGVGLDVVQNTVRQIGGTLQWQSQPGQGMQFQIRIPLSLAVMQALLVQCDERLFAIPVVNILGVTKIPVEEYRDFVDRGFMPYANADNPIFDLESLLELKQTPVTEALVTILVIESAGQRAAIRVTAFSSHQELVVKPLGPQLTSIPGILAGSISREGEVILILEPGALVSARVNTGRLQNLETTASVETRRKQPLVLIVDDSITMRKISSRVLEQHQIEVRTARDGLEAIEVMREEIPDLLLLDIEMPRMDGFELTAYMRASDNQLKDIPIIIVSSRSGDKHQLRARELGATDFIGKPYGEKDLMLKVDQLLASVYDQIAEEQA